MLLGAFGAHCWYGLTMLMPWGAVFCLSNVGEWLAETSGSHTPARTNADTGNFPPARPIFSEPSPGPGPRSSAVSSAGSSTAPGPGLTYLRDHAIQWLDRPGRRIDIAGSKSGTEQMVAAKNIQRQKTIFFIIPVEEPAQLLTVDRIIRGIQVNDDTIRRCVIRLDKDADK